MILKLVLLPEALPDRCAFTPFLWISREIRLTLFKLAVISPWPKLGQSVSLSLLQFESGAERQQYSSQRPCDSRVPVPLAPNWISEIARAPAVSTAYLLGFAVNSLSILPIHPLSQSSCRLQLKLNRLTTFLPIFNFATALISFQNPEVRIRHPEIFIFPFLKLISGILISISKTTSQPPQWRDSHLTPCTFLSRTFLLL